MNYKSLVASVAMLALTYTSKAQTPVRLHSQGHDQTLKFAYALEQHGQIRPEVLGTIVEDNTVDAREGARLDSLVRQKFRDQGFQNYSQMEALCGNDGTWRIFEADAVETLYNHINEAVVKNPSYDWKEYIGEVVANANGLVVREVDVERYITQNPW